MSSEHDRIEAIAGAIALGEATDGERDAYRRHIASCRPCLETFGGERDIERVASRVGEARECETWDPHLGDVVRARLGARYRFARYALSTLAACAIVAVGVRAAVVTGALRTVDVPAHRTVAWSGVSRIVLEPRHAPSVLHIAPAPQSDRRLVVVHNVVQIARARVNPPVQRHLRRPEQIAAMVIHPAPTPAAAADPVQSNVPIWRRNDPSWRTISRTTTTSFAESAPQSFTQHVESIRMMHPEIVREAAPVGGETAINPQPPMIAYDEGAEGTTAFEVLIDEQGNPTKCIITKPAGYAVLDDSVCKAAMRAKYVPKTIDGRPVPGIYHDAFTFRMTDDAGQ